MATKLSPSSLHLFRECKRCFWLKYNLGVSRPTQPFPTLNSGMDKVIKRYFDFHRLRRRLPVELKQFGKKAKLFRDRELLDEWRNNFKGLRWTDENGNVLMGAVDEILQFKDKYVVLDFKCRGYPAKESTVDSYKDQLNIYTFLLQENGYKISDHAFLLFYQPQEVTLRGNIIFQTDLINVPVSIDEAKKLFQEAISCLSGHIPKEECPFCKENENKK